MQTKATPAAVRAAIIERLYVPHADAFKWSDHDLAGYVTEIRAQLWGTPDKKGRYCVRIMFVYVPDRTLARINAAVWLVEKSGAYTRWDMERAARWLQRSGVGLPFMTYGVDVMAGDGFGQVWTDKKAAAVEAAAAAETVADFRERADALTVKAGDVLQTLVRRALYRDQAENLNVAAWSNGAARDGFAGFPTPEFSEPVTTGEKEQGPPLDWSIGPVWGADSGGGGAPLP